MESPKKTPPIVQAGAWLLSVIVFAIGFWHTHLGLKEMRPFGSEWGGLAIAGIVLLLILITYWYAINGKKMALIFYVLGGIIFFVCNLNYFYPAYLARQIVKEEAIALNDTLQSYANKSKTILNDAGFKNKVKDFKAYSNLQLIKKQLVTEIRDQAGWGPQSSKALTKFNEISKDLGYEAEPFSNAGGMSRETLANIYEDYLEGVIKKVLETLMINSTDGGVQNALTFMGGVGELDTLQTNYTTVLKDSIIPDNSDIKLEDVKTHPQIFILTKLATEINSATSKINSATKPDSFKFQAVEESRSRDLGRIANTFKSVKDRITKVDTWAIIILCLFVDLIVPLAIYLLLRKNGDEEDDITFKEPTKPETF